MIEVQTWIDDLLTRFGRIAERGIDRVPSAAPIRLAYERTALGVLKDERNTEKVGNVLFSGSLDLRKIVKMRGYKIRQGVIHSAAHICESCQRRIALDQRLEREQRIGVIGNAFHMRAHPEVLVLQCVGEFMREDHRIPEILAIYEAKARLLGHTARGFKDGHLLLAMVIERSDLAEEQLHRISLGVGAAMVAPEHRSGCGLGGVTILLGAVLLDLDQHRLCDLRTGSMMQRHWVFQLELANSLDAGLNLIGIDRHGFEPFAVAECAGAYGSKQSGRDRKDGDMRR